MRGAQATPLADERNWSISRFQLTRANPSSGDVFLEPKMPKEIENFSRNFRPKIENLQFLDTILRHFRKCARIVYASHDASTPAARARRASRRASRARAALKERAFSERKNLDFFLKHHAVAWC